MTDREETELVPWEMKALISLHAGQEGIGIDGIEPLVAITVKTRNSEYVLIRLEEDGRKVLMMGGFIDEIIGEEKRAEGLLIGSSAPMGSLLFSSRIQLGMSLECSFEHQGEVHHFKTSPIREVWLDEFKILPSDRAAIQ